MRSMRWWIHGATPWLRLVVGVVLLVALGLKLIAASGRYGPVLSGVDLFAAAIDFHGVFTRGMGSMIAPFVMVCEGIIGLWLVSHATPRWSGLAGIGLLVAFSLYLIAATRAGAECACFGRIHAGPASVSISRNALLILMLVPSVGGWRSPDRAQARPVDTIGRDESAAGSEGALANVLMD